jgi:hypothetical protein
MRKTVAFPWRTRAGGAREEGRRALGDHITGLDTEVVRGTEIRRHHAYESESIAGKWQTRAGLRELRGGTPNLSR